MKNKIISILITISITFMIVSTQVVTVQAQGGQTDFLNDCPVDSIDPDCRPPTLQTFEFVLVRFIYIAWALGGFLWLAYFILIAYSFFTSDTNKIEDAKSRFGRWLIGIVLFYLSRMIISSVMATMISGTSNCYQQFDGTPGFTFFFPDVCTG